jgi:hypothetical protein
MLVMPIPAVSIIAPKHMFKRPFPRVPFPTVAQMRSAPLVVLSSAMALHLLEIPILQIIACRTAAPISGPISQVLQSTFVFSTVVMRHME